MNEKLKLNDQNPTQRTQLELQEVNNHRFFNCNHYDYCLNEVAKIHWDSFTCTKCHLYIPPEERKTEPNLSNTNYDPDELLKLPNKGRI